MTQSCHLCPSNSEQILTNGYRAYNIRLSYRYVRTKIRKKLNCNQYYT